MILSRLAVYDDGKTKRVKGYDWSNLKSEQRSTYNKRFPNHRTLLIMIISNTITQGKLVIKCRRKPREDLCKHSGFLQILRTKETQAIMVLYYLFCI